jgi:cobalt-zinc-cadmium efflux system membrane fusion protein
MPAVRRLPLVAAVIIGVAMLGLTIGSWRSIARKTDAPHATEEKHADEKRPLAMTPEKRRALGVKAQPAESRVPMERMALTGKIIANPGRSVVVAPRTAGRAVKVNVQLGDSVEAGAVLALVDSPEASDALAELVQAESALRLAETEYERETLLVDRKISARKDMFRAEAALQHARAQRDKTRARLRLFGFTDAMLAEAEAKPGQRPLTPLVAPFRGTVIERQVVEGQLLDAQAIPFRIADLSTVWALLDVAEAHLPHVQLGQDATITAGGDGGVSYTGRVVYIADVVDEQTRTVKIRVEIPNLQRRFKPGMFVTAGLVTRRSGQPVVMVPRDAVVLLDDGPIVFVDRGERVEIRPVDVGPEVDGWIPIRRGIAVGEPVVIEGAFGLKAQLVKAKLGED